MLDHDIQALLSLDADAGPAHAIAPARATAIVDAALAGAGFGPAGGGGGAAAARAARPGLKLVLGGLGLALIAGVAILAVVSRNHAPSIATPPTVVAVVKPPAPPPPPVVDAAPAEIDVPEEPDEIEMPAVDARPMTKHEAEDLLAKANAERAGHRWKAADALYARVASGAPKTLAAQTALVASASIHLEHLNDARGAARKYRTVLRGGGGALAEDARWGLALALAGNPKAQAKALDDFLAHHPNSPLAPDARKRRAQLP